MRTIRRSTERGHANHGWLDSYHSFSFDNYYDPQHVSFRSLRVINEDIIAPGQGFSTHPHHDMEIITYVLGGVIAHKDSIGNGSTIQPGDVQRMSAGTGITHSEFNPSAITETHLLQIWIAPEQVGIEPSYEQKQFPRATKQGKFALLASRDGRNSSITVHQDMNLYATVLDNHETTAMPLDTDRHYWAQVTRGRVAVNGETLTQGDAIQLSAERELSISGIQDAEVLVFDLA